MDKIANSGDSGRSQIMPSVTVRIGMPQGAAVPPQATPAPGAPALTPGQATPASKTSGS